MNQGNKQVYDRLESTKTEIEKRVDNWISSLVENSNQMIEKKMNSLEQRTSQFELQLSVLEQPKVVVPESPKVSKTKFTELEQRLALFNGFEHRLGLLETSVNSFNSLKQRLQELDLTVSSFSTFKKQLHDIQIKNDQLAALENRIQLLERTSNQLIGIESRISILSQ